MHVSFDWLHPPGLHAMIDRNLALCMSYKWMAAWSVFGRFACSLLVRRRGGSLGASTALEAPAGRLPVLPTPGLAASTTSVEEPAGTPAASPDAPGGPA